MSTQQIGSRSSRSRAFRAAAAGAATALFAFATSALAVGAPDHCIVGDNAIGCRSERTVAMLTGGFRGSGDSLRQQIESQLVSGSCRLFTYGERVYTTDLASALRTAVRRPGDASTYYMPASWARPVSECADTPSASMMERKLGMSAVRENAAPDDASEAADRYASDEPGSDGFKPGLARLMAHQGATRFCIIKPVMSDAEIAACRTLER